MFLLEKQKAHEAPQVIIDGSNVAFKSSDGEIFSAENLRDAIVHYAEKGCNVIAIVPYFRMKINKTTNNKLMQKMRNKGYVLLSPGKELGRHKMNSYDDAFTVEAAKMFDAVIVSNDLFLDFPSLSYYDNAGNRIMKQCVIQFTISDDGEFQPEQEDADKLKDVSKRRNQFAKG